MRVYLRAFQLDDYRLINQWRNDEEVTRLTAGNRFYVPPERDKKWVEEKLYDDSKQIYWAICLKETGEMIGYTGITDINWINRTADLHALVIGDPKHRNLRNSTDAVYMVLKYVFDDLGLNRVFAFYLEEHQSSILLGRMMGFKQEGVSRDHVYKDGRYHNVVWFGLLRDEFERLRSKYAECDGAYRDARKQAPSAFPRPLHHSA